MVVKVGSALIAPDGSGVQTTHMLSIARLISASRKKDRQVILVSSGAVAAGLSSFPDLVRKRSIPTPRCPSTPSRRPASPRAPACKRSRPS